MAFKSRVLRSVLILKQKESNSIGTLFSLITSVPLNSFKLHVNHPLPWMTVPRILDKSVALVEQFGKVEHFGLGNGFF